MLPQELQEFEPVSQSPIWQMVRSYYRQMSLKAWHTSAVPNYITTNPFIASRYAMVIDGFFSEFSKSRKTYTSEDPFYIFELGAGSGRFGYCFLKYFFSELERSIRGNGNFVYVMTDISKANIDFWRGHPQLQSFINRGVLDFAYLDVMAQESIELLVSGKKLGVGSTGTPMAVIANYVFDSLPHDLFEIRNGSLRARLIRCRTNLGENDIAEIAQTTQIDYRAEKCEQDYYENSDWNAVLEDYCKTEKNLNFAIPVGGLMAIEKMSSLTTGPMFMLASDFGDSDIISLRSLPKRHVATNGCYSVRVNFQAIAKYMSRVGGRFYSPGQSKSSLETVGLVMNMGSSKQKHLSHTFQTHINNFGPDEFFMMKKIVERNFDSHDFQHIIGILRMACWDAKIFTGCAPALKASFEALDPWQIKTVIQTLRNVDDMYFRCDDTADPAILIIDLLLTMGEDTVAREILHKNDIYLRQTEAGAKFADRVGVLLN